MQGQLGVNKKKLLIELEASDDEKTLFVYLGLTYYTRIPNDPKSVQYRLLVGQLALAGFSIVQLMNAFNVSRPTIYRYRDIVGNYADETEMFAKLRGRHCDRTKLTPEVEAFLKTRFEKIYQANRASYNSQLRAEIEKQFDIKLSPEAVRQVIAPLRQELSRLIRDAKAEQDVASEAAPEASEFPGSIVPKTSGTESDTNQQQGPAAETHPVETESCVCGSWVEVCEPQTAPDTIVAGNFGESDEGRVQLYLHAGLLVLNFWMAGFATVFQSWGSCFVQWLYQIFSGAVNLEQSRYLPRHEVSDFIGEAAVSVSKSRSLLRELAHDSFRECLQLFLQTNLDFVMQHLRDRINYFYIDGHFDPYYGKTEILKGWTCLFNRAMKGSNHYVIHDSCGYPLFKEVTDCYADFREYIKKATGKLKEIMPGICFGLVFDRGGFSREILRFFVEAGVYFFTWQKYFDIDKEPELDFKSKVVIEREINEVGKTRQISFECAETTYRFGDTEEAQCRKLVIPTYSGREKKHKQ